MCGIFAYIDFNSDSLSNGIKDSLNRDLDLLDHRGPDSTGNYCENNIYLGHKRLSIIDLSQSGSQPMSSHDDRYVIIYNGEVYNYLELKEEFLDDKLAFKSSTDSEVILNLYIKLGTDIFKHLNGMFAFVIYDKKENEIVICRDRYGIKPIYYRKTSKKLIIASEIKCLISHVDDLQPNDTIIAEYLTQGRVDHKDETFFTDIYRFPASHYSIIPLNGDTSFTFVKYWDQETEISTLRRTEVFANRDETQHLTQLREILKNAIEIRYRSDVPVGSCLSGGIDSSGIVTISNSQINTGYKLRSYSAVYGEWFAQDESKYIDLINSDTNIEGYMITPRIEDINNQFRDFINHQEEPVLGYSQFTQYKVMELAKSKDQKVLLDGQGADEIFAGYPYMRGYYLAELLINLNLFSFFKQFGHELKNKNFLGLGVFGFQFLPTFIGKRLVLNNLGILSEKYRHTAKNSDFLESGFYHSRNLNLALLNHIRYKLQDLLRWEDKNSMAFSIESRTPYLDYRFVTYVLALPSEYKIRENKSKWALREILFELPDKIKERTDKIGFASPDHQFLKDKNNQGLNELCKQPHSYLYTIFNANKLNDLLEIIKERSFKESQENIIFRILCLDIWLKEFFPRLSNTQP